MPKETQKFTAVRITPEKLLVTSQLEMPIGQYHIVNTSEGMGTSPVFNAIKVISGIITALIHIGIISSGFQAIAPKTTGSLMLSTPGTDEARPRALRRFD